MNDTELDSARRELYRLAPDEFLAARDARVSAAEDPDLAQALKALRKPTLAAWIVNAHAAGSPELVPDLHDLHHRLLDAHSAGDPAALRELTQERRQIVGRLVRDAVAACGRAVSASVADDVLATFDAAVADPDVAARLGALQRGERWSGFGVSTATRGLSLVPSGPPGRRAPGAQPGGGDGSGAGDAVGAGDVAGAGDEAGDAAGDGDAAGHAEDERAVAAREAFEQAEEELESAQAAEDELAHRIRRLTTRLTTLQHDLEQARRDQTAARAATAGARKARRTARSELDRAERRA